jgi:hypothetical protein
MVRGDDYLRGEKLGRNGKDVSYSAQTGAQILGVTPKAILGALGTFR